MSASNACADDMIENWSGKLRNAPLMMVEICQTMCMHLLVLDP